jgi:L-alanine-DL-glutamate epimerase-like enolase superfamily enzyme
VESLDTRCYTVPTDRPEADGTLAWDKTTVVVVFAHAGDETGVGWTYGSAASAAVIGTEITAAVGGRDAMDVGGANEAMVRACRNLGRPGVVGHAVSAVDVALWDLKARLLGTSVRRLLGRQRVEIPIYGSGGFTTYDDRATEEQCRHWVDDLGVGAVKIKIGESWGARTDRDLARVALVRKLVGGNKDLMVDANGAYRRKQAVRMGRRMHDEWGVVWFEEPVTSDDLEGLRMVRDLTGPDVTAGEYGYDPGYFARMVGAGAVDCLQADVTRCGGFTGWLQAATVAHAHHLDVSAHCGPNLHAFVAGAAPNLRHVEYFHDHARIDPMLFDGLPRVNGGVMRLDDGVAGLGVTVKEADAEQWRSG